MGNKCSVCGADLYLEEELNTGRCSACQAQMRAELAEQADVNLSEVRSPTVNCTDCGRTDCNGACQEYYRP